jgi:single-stranded DNA-binding protein
MNNLNSVLIEGYCTDEKTPDELPNGASQFSIVSHRYYRESKDAKLDKEECRIAVTVQNAKLAETARDKWRPGRGLRVVGRLAETAIKGAHCIVAEHVEWRPEDVVKSPAKPKEKNGK